MAPAEAPISSLLRNSSFMVAICLEPHLERCPYNEVPSVVATRGVRLGGIDLPQFTGRTHSAKDGSCGRIPDIDGVEICVYTPIDESGSSFSE